MTRLALIAVLFIAGSVYGFAGLQTNDYGIVLLKSSRAEVEKRYGKPETARCRACTYRTADAVIQVSYSGAGCREASGWNVPSGTVLAFSVIPGTQIRVNALDQNDVRLPIRINSQVRLVSQKKGEVYYLDEFGKTVTEVRYVPTADANKLRCRGFPPYNPIGALYPPTSQTFSTGLEELKAEIDNAMAHGSSAPAGYDIYIIVYSGANISGRQFRNLLGELRQYIREYGKTGTTTFSLVNGGRRDKFSFEMFILEKGFPPPVPRTISLRQLISISSPRLRGKLYLEQPGTSVRESVARDEFALFDTFFMDIDKPTRRDHLSNFALALNSNSRLVGFVIIYNVENDKKRSAVRYLKSIQEFLICDKKIVPSRLSFVMANPRKRAMTELYIGSPGAVSPIPGGSEVLESSVVCHRK